MPLSRPVKDALTSGSWIRRMFEEGTLLKSRLGADAVFDFTLGNPYGDPPAAVLAEITRLSREPALDLHKYMSNAGFPEVRAAVAASLATQTEVPFEARHVVMTVGAAGALNVALRALLSPGDEVLVLAPYFVEYLFYIRNAGGTPVIVETDSDFLPDAAAVARALTPRTRAVILNTPNNPTGAVYPAGVLDALELVLRAHEAAGSAPVYVLSDEPYRKIVYAPVRHEPPAAHFTNALIAYSHSKDLNLPGERIGYLAISPRATDAEEVVEGCVFCNRTLGFVNAPSLLQRAVAPFQDHPADLSVYRSNRDQLIAILGEAGFEVAAPDGAFYVFMKTPEADELTFVDAARAENVLVVPGRGFGRPGFVRLAYCVSPDTVTRSAPAWKRIAKQVLLNRL